MKTGIPCQDAHCFLELPNGILIVAVGDGAGSAPLSEFGSQLAVKTSVEHALANYQRVGEMVGGSEHEGWAKLLRENLEAARSAVLSEASSREVMPCDLATTLIVAVSSGKFISVAQIGDGAVVARDADGSIEAVSRPQTGEYVNETTFLTSDYALEHAYFGSLLAEVSHLAVFSDGLQLLALQLGDGGEAQAFPPFFEPLFQFASSDVASEDAHRELVSFLESDRVASKTDDDLTLVLASLGGAES